LPPASDELPDPRIFPDASSASEPARAVYALAERALSADVALEADACERELRIRLLALLQGPGTELGQLLAESPSVSVTRQVWRVLDALLRDATRADNSALEVTMFAIPLVIVVGREGGEGGVLPGFLSPGDAVAAILRDHDALAGNKTFALSNALIAAEDDFRNRQREPFG